MKGERENTTMSASHVKDKGRIKKILHFFFHILGLQMMACVKHLNSNLGMVAS